MQITKLNIKRLFKQYSGQPTSLLCITLIIVISIAVYFNSLFNGFVFDDIFQVLNNPWLKSPKFIPNIFTSNAWGFEGKETVYYRPLMHIIYMITAAIFGLNPWGFHFVNILFHAGVSILIFLIGLRLFKQYDSSRNSLFLFPPFMAAALFSVHPIHTEAVAWIGGIPDLSYTFFLLTSFYFYLRASDNTTSPFNVSYLFAITSFFLSTLCKEPALILPIILVGYDFTFKRMKMTFTACLKQYSVYIIVVFVYFVMRLYALKGFAPIAFYSDLSTYQSIINIFPLFKDYLISLLWPFNLSVWHTFHPISALFEEKGMISAFVFVIFSVIGVMAYRKNKLLFFGLLLLVLPLLPAFYIKGIGGTPFAERYLYLPSVGYVLLQTIFLLWIKEKLQFTVGSITLVFLVIFALYAVGTINRNNVWENNYTLWTDTIKKAPDAASPHFNLGNALTTQGRIDEAIEQYQIALRLEPTKGEAHDNLGIAYVKKGELDKAVTEFQLALQSNFFSPNVYNNLGTTYAMMGYLDKAIEYYKMAVALKPDNVRFQKNLLEAYEKKKASDAKPGKN